MSVSPETSSKTGDVEIGRETFGSSKIGLPPETSSKTWDAGKSYAKKTRYRMIKMNVSHETSSGNAAPKKPKCGKENGLLAREPCTSRLPARSLKTQELEPTPLDVHDPCEGRAGMGIGTPKMSPHQRVSHRMRARIHRIVVRHGPGVTLGAGVE